MLADIVLVVHFVWVAVIVMSVPLIALGGERGWRWVRNRWFRRIHLGMMGIVAAEAVCGVVCPLTEWEGALRSAPYRRGFLAHWLGRILYYDFPPWAFTSAYLAFLALIVAFYFRYPPRS